MQKFHSHQLKRVHKDRHLLDPRKQLSQLEAEELLFQISKFEDNDEENAHDDLIKNMSRSKGKQSPNQKRYEKAAGPLFKKKETEILDKDELINLRKTYLQFTSKPLGLTNYVVMDSRTHRRGYSEMSGQISIKTHVQSKHEQINRKAKHLFRMRNKGRLPSLDVGKSDISYQTFYCSKMASPMDQRN